jgi:YHS domain-containing protein
MALAVGIRRKKMEIFENQQKRVIIVLLVIGLCAFSTPIFSVGIETNSEGDKVAIKGYDAVAYFTEGNAVKGNSQYSYRWDDARWYFSTPEHRQQFSENPEQYAPQFGGYCANGLSHGVILAADPEEWTIVDGKLYLKYNREARDEWRQDQTGMIKKAEEQWAKIHQ